MNREVLSLVLMLLTVSIALDIVMFFILLLKLI